MPKATDLTFAAALHKAHKEQPHFSTLSMAHMRGVKLRDEECFVVRHYAADVCYGAAGFLEKVRVRVRVRANPNPNPNPNPDLTPSLYTRTRTRSRPSSRRSCARARTPSCASW